MSVARTDSTQPEWRAIRHVWGESQPAPATMIPGVMQRDAALLTHFAFAPRMQFLIHRALIGLGAPRRMMLYRQMQGRLSWDRQRIRGFQDERLRQLIAYCWERVPFYRRHWQDAIRGPQDIRSVADLVRLPLLTKDHVRNHLDALTTTDPRVKYSPARTGGSTGRPVVFRMTSEDEQLAWAQMYVGWSWAGYRVGDPFLAVGGESIGIGLGDRRVFKDKVMNRWVSSGSNLTLDRARALASAPHFHRLRLIYGYPNSIRELCEFLVQLGERPRALRGVVCTAEVMRPEVRERIQQVLGVSVLDQYGLNDGGLHACEGPERDRWRRAAGRGPAAARPRDRDLVLQCRDALRAIRDRRPRALAQFPPGTVRSGVAAHRPRRRPHRRRAALPRGSQGADAGPHAGHALDRGAHQLPVHPDCRRRSDGATGAWTRVHLVRGRSRRVPTQQDRQRGALECRLGGTRSDARRQAADHPQRLAGSADDRGLI